MKIFTFKQGGFTAFLRAALLLVMMFTSSVTFAEYSFPAYISDLKLIGGTEKETAELLKKYKAEGWTCTNYDLNYGCKSSADHIYLLYKSTVFASTNGGFVTDLIIHNDKWKETIQNDGRTYYAVPYEGGKHFVKVHGDLNSNAGGGDYHLYYTKENFPNKKVVDDIRIYATTEKDVDLLPLLREYEVCGWNLNGGCKGCKTKLFLYWRTQTKVNRPETSQLFYNSLVYNGESQTLIKPNIVAKNGCTLMFEVDDKDRMYSSEIYTSDVNKIVAKEAGNHTVYVYAKGNEYGVESGVASYTVKIAKASNTRAYINVPDDHQIHCVRNILSSLPLVNNLSTGKVTYKFRRGQNGEYTTTLPDDCSQYWVTATIAGDNNCEEYTTSPNYIDIYFWEGHGTSESPYLIKTVEDLNVLSETLRGKYWWWDYYFRMENDIVFSGKNNFKPIGGAAHFMGNFDGNGKTICGIDVDAPDSYYCGLFGKIGEYATVKNVTLSNCKFNALFYCGGIVGYCDNGKVENCVVKDVQVTANSCNCGGIAGCSKDGSVTNNIVKNVSISSANYAGAICGEKTVNASFSNNYYIDCNVDKWGNIATSNIGCHSVDISENNGAVQVYSLACPKTVEASTASTLTYGGVDYYVAGTKILVKYTGSKPREGNFMIDMFVNGEIIRGGKFVMPAQNATVTSKIVYLNFISHDEEITIDAKSRKTDRKSGNKLYASGITVNLSYTEPDDKIFKGYVVNGVAITGNSFEMPNKSVTVSATWEQLYSLTLSGNVTTSTPATKTGADGTKYYAVGTQIELTSTVDGEIIKNFTVNGEVVTGNSFTMPAKNVVVSASLVQKKFAVKLGGNDLTRGSVTGDGEYVYGSTVTVTATAKEGYVFVGWMDENENIVSTEASYRFTATDNQRLTAVFKVDESTGIETVNAQSDEDVWYTLNGHKLAGKPTQKGVYIHNNKKVIIK